jgi:hypothetical protein
VSSGVFGIPSGAFEWDRTNNEIIIARRSKGTKTNYNGEILLHIAFDQIEIVSGEPAGPILNAFTSEVEGILLAIEAEARRIGLIVA